MLVPGVPGAGEDQRGLSVVRQGMERYPAGVLPGLGLALEIVSTEDGGHAEASANKPRKRHWPDIMKFPRDSAPSRPKAAPTLSRSAWT